MYTNIKADFKSSHVFRKDIDVDIDLFDYKIVMIFAKVTTFSPQ